MDLKSLIDENGHAVIPNGVTEIGWNAFWGCTGLTSIEIPDSVTEIGEYAFEDCFRLTSIEIPDSVTIIRWWAFAGCTGLTNISIHTKKEKPEDAAKAINEVLSAYGDDKVTLYIPIGTGYAYRHYPFKGRLKEVIIEK